MRISRRQKLACLISAASLVGSLPSAYGNAMNLVAGSDLSLQGGSTLQVSFGSHMTAADLSPSGMNGTIRVDGAGSSLTLNGSLINNVIGMDSSGTLIFQNGGAGNVTGEPSLQQGSAPPPAHASPAPPRP